MAAEYISYSRTFSNNTADGNSRQHNGDINYYGCMFFRLKACNLLSRLNQMKYR